MNGVIRWFGGKGGIAKKIYSKFPPIDKYTTYVEPFGGGASLLFYKPLSKVEVYNDKDLILYNFFTILRERPDEFQELVQLKPWSRSEYYHDKQVLELKDFPDPLQAAVMFFVVARQCVSGDVNGGWSHGIKTNPVPGWLSAIRRLPEICQRFKHVQVENLDAMKCIEKYDTPETMFYIDPPYNTPERGSTRYRMEIGSSYHHNLFHLLKGIEGMAMLSGYHGLLYDTKLKDWYYHDINTVNQAAATTGKLKGDGVLKEKHKVTEVIWWNQALEDAYGEPELPFSV